MATSAASAALTEAHRIEQNRNSLLVTYVVTQLWLRTIVADDIDTSAANLIARLIPLLRQRRDFSAITARKYYQEFRKLEVRGGDGFELPAMTEMDIQALETSLRVMGPVALKTKIGELPKTDIGPDLQPRIHPSLIQNAIEETATMVAGAATRHVLNGSRDEIQSALDEDPVALGYIRVTDADPCYFCAMLASRGPVYGDDSFDQSDPRFIGEGSHKVHDHCGCGVEPVYDRKTAWPGRARDAEEAWIALSKDLGRVPTINDFRKRWEGRD
jgi:hypothetical protein